jgi:glycosyltransferase involved in cell wall biosynthesis
MKVALDATYSLGEHLSGVGVYSREIIGHLADAHAEATFLLYYRPHKLWRSYGAALASNCKRLLLQEPLAPRGDLWHGLNQRLPRLRLRRPVVTFHDLFVLTGEYSTPEFRARFAGQARDAAARAELIIAVSEFTARQVRELLGVESSRIRVIHHGVGALSQTGGQAAPEEREKIILHVGAIQTRKNLARLVRAFEAVPEGWHLMLAGSMGFGAEQVLAAVEQSPRRESISILGYVSPADLARLYRRASVFAFPSLDEGFGMPVLEAMAHGVPVLASNRSALPEVTGDAAMLVDPMDTAAIQGGLVKLTTEEARRQDLARRGQLRAANFSWAKAAQQTWRVYEEVMGLD